ncbi:hypothetical protein RO21_07530 [[Actinobacillus] muris]|uniref:4'-phosphopantetheinyl transferase domain-containing protein n=1 Tax=Muribacter muris TaxID=67855 RepID=A0A0J5S307_9PAST|nr:4'-phosphopantetheinyl transferase superfamily protein [Muribacter muris]KMK51192.1 hypothetical protein RO21_07530 [[Actinobacillus] muris] [Muribacter muris]
MKTDRLQILFAHNDEALPPAFSPTPPPHLSARLLRKWKSRRTAHFLLNRLLQQSGLDPDLLKDMQRTISDRPYLDHDRLDFNISHSGDWVAVIFSLSQPKRAVGIDIEHPQKVRRYRDLFRYFAAESEIAEIENGNILPQLDRLSSRFYLSWCLREAVLKSQGVGIVKLSEVRHSLAQQRIFSAHCPKGELHFYHQLPFYLAYFFEQSGFMLSSPTLAQWQNGQIVPIQYSPIIYQVN